MDFSNHYTYEYCEECGRQKPFCRCENPRFTGGEEKAVHQDISEYDPSQSQSIGEQEQQQQQQQGGLDQEQGNQSQGPQFQEQMQEGQKQGPQHQDQEQEGQEQCQSQEQGSPEQGSPNQSLQQNPDLDGDQEIGDQILFAPLTNNQTISTPVDVDGVNVNVKCGDCRPVIIFSEEFKKKKKKNRKHGDCDCGCDDIENCDCECDEDMDNCNCKSNRENGCSQSNNCCVQSLSDLLNQVRVEQARLLQSGITDAANRQIDLYLNTVTSLVNPVQDQIIRSVDNCVARFRSAATPPPTGVPANLTVQLCDVAGICADNVAGTTDDVFQFLLNLANAEPTDSDCKTKRKKCCCPCCAFAIGEELRCIANLGIDIPVNIYVQGVTVPPLEGFLVLSVRDCLAFFARPATATTPRRICVFSLCSIAGFTAVSP